MKVKDLITDIENLKNKYTFKSEKNKRMYLEVSYLFDKVIEKALKKNPAERYQHASEISTALSDFVESFASRRSTTV